jgi:hypothetical protein
MITSYLDCSVEPLWCGLSLACWSLSTVLFGEGAKLRSFYLLVPLCWEGAASCWKIAVTCDKGGRYYLEECHCLYSDIAGCFRGISCGCCPLVWLPLPLFVITVVCWTLSYAIEESSNIISVVWLAVPLFAVGGYHLIPVCAGPISAIGFLC